MKKLEPITPGELLASEYLEPLGLSQQELAEALRVDPVLVGEIVKGSRSITADTALRLARYFGTTAQYWLNLQSNFELAIAKGATSLNAITPLRTESR